MEEFKRYAVYYAPRAGAFADAAARWLGRDAVTGLAVQQPDGLHDITVDARRYGFHGTLRAPFRLAVSVDMMLQAVAELAAGLPPVVCAGLHLENLEGFLALTPEGDTQALLEFAAAVVVRTNDLRAPLTAAEVARRRPEALRARQRELLDLWGYPYVMEAFQFHLTLTDRLGEDADRVADRARAHFAGVLPCPFVIEDLCVFGEDAKGVFHLLHRYALTG